MSIPNDDLIVAYVYGELRGEEATAFEARLEEDADLRAEVEGLMAARSLLDVDKENAEKFGFDEPPAHLYASIMNAEPLVRPREMTAAAAAVQRPESAGEAGWFHRLRMWIVGGGAALTAAAALMLLVQTGDQAEPAPAAMATPEAPAQSGPKEEAGRRRLSRAVNDQADDGDGRFGDGFANDAEAKPSAPEEEKALRADAPSEPSPEPDAVADKSGRGGDLNKFDAKLKLNADPVAEPVEKPAPTVRAQSRAEGIDELRERQRKVRRAPAKRARAKPKADLAPKDRDFGAGGGVDDDLGFAQPAPPPPPAPAPATSIIEDEGVAGLAVTGSTSSAAGETKRAPGVVRFKDTIKARAGAKAKKKGAKEEKSRSVATETDLKAQARANKQSEEAQMAFSSAELARRQGRNAEAFQLYERAGVLDRSRTLGFGPRVGKMKVLRTLDRCKEVLPLAGALERAKLGRPYVVEGLFVAAACAEQLGDDNRAEAIYTRLYGFPPTRDTAAPNLRRVRRKMMDFDAPAAAESADER